MFRAIVLSCLAALALPGCKERPKAEIPDVIVLHTGRMRGNVYPPGMKAPLQHYPFIAGYVKAVREEAAKTGAKVVLLDLGDSLSGSFAAHATSSENMAAFFNALGYDAIALSNLDSAVPLDTLSKIRAKVLTPFAGPGGKPAPAMAGFSAKFDKEGLPVAAMANFYGDASPEKFPARFPKSFAGETDVTPVREYRADEAAGPDGLTLLTWMKLENPAHPPQPFLDSLGKAGIDAIAAHRIYGTEEREVWEPTGLAKWSPPASVNILRNNGGFVLARLDLKRDGAGWRVLDQKLVPMTANSATADPTISEEIGRFAQTIAAKDAKITDLPARVGSDGILDTYVAALASIPGTGAALYSREAIRSDWPAGELRASEVFNALPWTSPVVQVSLPREKLEAAVKELGLQGAISPDATGDIITVSTSEFFARLLAGGFGATGERAIAPSEFDWFLGELARDPSPRLPEGWKPISGER